MSDVDDAIAAAHASWSRISDAPAQPLRLRRGGGPGKRLVRMIAAFVVILLAAGTVNALVGSLGVIGTLLVLLLLVGAVTTLAIWPSESAVPPAPDKLRTVDLRALPAQTDRWLRAQRPQLPPPAQHLLDRIGERLDTLSPQLARVEADSETALEIRRLIGEQLPAFVADYGRVPEPLRRTPRNGRTPDAALSDGLSVIEREIAGMTARLAQDDLDSLQTRGRYLEMRYSGDPPA